VTITNIFFGGATSKTGHRVASFYQGGSGSKPSDRSVGAKMPSRREKQAISLRNHHPAGGI